MQGEYRLVSYADRDAPRAGVVIGGRIVPLRFLTGGRELSVLEILRDWDLWVPRLEEASRNGVAGEASMAPGEVRLLAPVLYPGAFFCAGANYWDHLEEMASVAKALTGVTPSMEKAAEPWFFVKTAVGTIIGDHAPVRLPAFSNAVDWEAELGVVIGRPARNVPEADALASVAGYVIVNDLSARDHIRRDGSPFIYDWIGQKCFDDAAPMGPWLTPAASVPDPHNLDIKLWVNGVLKQSSNTRQMIHRIEEQISYLSRHVTLQPGDVIATGTPAGVGMPKEDFLKPGDVVRIEIERLGALSNQMVAEPDAAPAQREDAHAA